MSCWCPLFCSQVSSAGAGQSFSVIGGSLGPPFEVTAADVRSLYGAAFEIRELSRENRLSVEPQLRARGCTRFEEVVYLLVKN